MTMPSSLSPQPATAAVAAGLRRANRDVDLSPEDAARQVALYQNNLAHYRQHVWKSLDEGDYLQAAEKSWGAYAQIIKSIGADRQFALSHHGVIVGVAARLASLVGGFDPIAGDVLSSGLAYARSLHQHFCENDLPDEMVIASSEAVAAAIDLLQRLFPPEPNAA